MRKFAPSEKSFYSCRNRVAGGKGKELELTALNDNRYSLTSHRGDYVEEIAEFTYEELKTLWMMLTKNS